MAAMEEAITAPSPNGDTTAVQGALNVDTYPYALVSFSVNDELIQTRTALIAL
jgi:hypothetical protein